MTSWTEFVKCRRCGAREWSVNDGGWTCSCGQPMHDPSERSPHCEVCSRCSQSYPCDPDCRICWPAAAVGDEQP